MLAGYREYCIKNRHSKGPYLVSQGPHNLIHSICNNNHAGYSSGDCISRSTRCKLYVFSGPSPIFLNSLIPFSIHGGRKGVSNTLIWAVGQFDKWLTPSSLVYGGRRFALISPNWITGIFVSMDFVSIVAQAIGAAMLFNDSLSLDELKKARLILEAGLFVQVIGFSIFLFIAVWFDVKTTRHLGGRIAHLRWFMNAFYISGALIMIRSIYRLAGTYDYPRYTECSHQMHCRIHYNRLRRTPAFGLSL